MTIRGQFFGRYPKITYNRESANLPQSGGSPYIFQIEMTDLLVRYRIRDAITQNAALMFPYNWRDGDTPESVAYKYYGASTYAWLIFLSNDAFDLNFDFPLSSLQLNEFLVEKYKADVIADAEISEEVFDAYTISRQIEMTVTFLSNTHHHYEFYFEDDPEQVFTIDHDTFEFYSGNGYAAEVAAADVLGTELPAAIARDVDTYTYELEVNEAKRTIKVLDRAYLRQVVAEFNGRISTVLGQRAAVENA